MSADPSGGGVHEQHDLLFDASEGRERVRRRFHPGRNARIGRNLAAEGQLQQETGSGHRVLRSASVLRGVLPVCERSESPVHAAFLVAAGHNGRRSGLQSVQRHPEEGGEAQRVPELSEYRNQPYLLQ